MSKIKDKPITIQIMDQETEEWIDLFYLHAEINKAKTDSEYLGGGSMQSKRSLTFDVRFFSELKKIALNTQIYRVMYEGVPYNVTDYDDYKMRHKNIRLLGESY